ncbi:MAG: glycerophosphodiester phosphodiesterase [Alphaproteobacteria bacterium]|nr:glycerophosphodiester phosphodiesterase [Alphaproteobacteria bacterium]
MAVDGPVAIAHRGSSGDHPENTMIAFADAVAQGYRYVETDVHATRDGVLVAFHDHRLDRVTDRAGAIAELDWGEVRQARVHGREPIPRFEEVAEAWPDLRLNIDPKADGAVAPLIAALGRPGVLDRVCVGSFASRRLRELRRALGPDLCTSMAPGEVARLRLASLGWPARSFAADCVQVPPRKYGLPVIDGRFVQAAHRRGLKVHVWTVNERAAMEWLLDLGVDGIMTDRTALLKSVFEARGLWPAEQQGEAT